MRDRRIARGAKQLEKASCVTVPGRNVATALVACAQENGFDHLVMGTLGHSALERLMTGSVVDEVVNRPHAAVAVV